MSMNEHQGYRRVYQAHGQPVLSHDSYDVFVAPSGATFEYGPSRMRVKGHVTAADRSAFVAHCTKHSVEARDSAVVCGVKVQLW